jgi:hypothetical protein
MKKRNTRQPAATPDMTNLPDPASAPLTPSDVLTQACACCGAILPSPLSRLDAIPGQEHLRRAVTVALTGNHPITFLGSRGALADALAFGRITRHYGVTAYVTTPCICGNAGDPYLACRCSPEALVAWQHRPAFQAALAADLVVEAAHTSAEQRMAHRRGRRGEPDEQLIARATEARSRPRSTDALDGVCQRLLAAAIRQLQLTTGAGRAHALRRAERRSASAAGGNPAGASSRGAPILAAYRTNRRSARARRGRAGITVLGQ